MRKMSKQSDAKAAQHYSPKTVPQTCMNCVSFTFDRVQTRQPSMFCPNGRWEDKNIRCSLGGFAVKKMGTCIRFEAKIT